MYGWAHLDHQVEATKPHMKLEVSGKEHAVFELAVCNVNFVVTEVTPTRRVGDVRFVSAAQVQGCDAAVFQRQATVDVCIVPSVYDDTEFSVGIRSAE